VRVIARKAFPFAPQALPQLLMGFPIPGLQVAGQRLAMPSCLTACQSLIEEHGPARHDCLLDYVDRFQPAREYAQCTLMLLPTVKGTAPVVIAEAMAARVPVVATCVGRRLHTMRGGTRNLQVDRGEVTGGRCSPGKWACASRAGHVKLATFVGLVPGLPASVVTQGLGVPIAGSTSGFLKVALLLSAQYRAGPRMPCGSLLLGPPWRCTLKLEGAGCSS
jgi:hypothetical protein